jgi:hypothetical protein
MTTKTMKRTPYKMAALVLLGLAGISTVKASTTDLLLGFNDAAGPNAAQNDYVIDLGLSGTSLIADALASPNSTYNLSSTFSSSTFTGAFDGNGGDANYLNDVAAGVVGGITGAANPKYLFQTDLIGNTPAAIHSGQFNDAAASAQSPAIGQYASASTSGWSAYVAASPTSPGTLVSGDDVADQTGNPLGQLSSGDLSLALWEDTRTGTSTIGGWVDEGTFNINVDTDTISFTAAAVPEPATYGLFSGVGLLMLALRRQLGKVA